MRLQIIYQKCIFKIHKLKSKNLNKLENEEILFCFAENQFPKYENGLWADRNKDYTMPNELYTAEKRHRIVV